MARADRFAIADLGIPESALMEAAAVRTAEVAAALLEGVAGRRIVALCGRGNNGGDALASLRHLAGGGADILALLASDIASLHPLARAHAEALSRMGVSLGLARDAAEIEGADLLLDGLLGYGARGAPRGEVARMIDAANRSGVPILAVDLPSGIDSDTGLASGVAIHAFCTVTLAMPKRGLLEPAARDHVGTLVVADIGLPAMAYGRSDLDPRALFARGPIVRMLL